MQKPIRPLEDLRREIDEVDDAIHDLIMRRTALVAGVAAAKGSGPGTAAGAFLRPGREMAVLRRLMARHHGAFPKPALVRLWRQLISAPLSLQGAVSVAVYAPKDEPGYWDLARDHYGSTTRFLAHGTPSQVIGALSDGSAVLGVLPVMLDEEPDPWWRHLARQDAPTHSVIARLPIAGQGNARGERLEALVVGPAPPEPTGRDHSYLAFEADEISRTRLRDQLAKVGLEPCFFATWQEQGGGRRLYLVELSDFVAKDDARLANFIEEAGASIGRVFFLGSYALPFAPEELAPEAGAKSKSRTGRNLVGDGSP